METNTEINKEINKEINEGIKLQDKKLSNNQALVILLIAIKIFIYIEATHVASYKLLIFLTSLGLSGLVISLIRLFKLKIERSLITAYYIGLSLVLFIDLVHYSYFGSLTSVKQLAQVNLLNSVKDVIFMLLSFKSLLLILDIPFFIYFYAVKKYDLGPSLRPAYSLFYNLVLLSILFTRSIHTEKIGALKAQEPHIYHFYDIVDKDSKKLIEHKDLERLDQWISDKKLELNTGEKELRGIAQGRNLIVVQVESLQEFVVERTYENQELTPFLNSFIEDPSTIYFTNYFQQLGRGNTSDAEFTSHNSIHPSMEEYTYLKYPDNSYYGLVHHLRDQGYSAWAYHGYKKEFWNRDKAYPGQGFQRFISEEDYQIGEEIGFGLTDKDFFSQSLEYMEEQRQEGPFYSFLVTLTCHTPFEMGDKYQQIDIKEEDKGYVANYFQAVYYTDQALEEFIQGLKDRGLYDDSVIAIYGDHFAIYSGDEDNYNMMTKLLDQPYYYDHMMNIPLLIHIPGTDINRKIDKVGSQLDFYPTMMNLLGLDYEKGIVFGKDIINYQGDYRVPAQTYMRKGSYIDKDQVYTISRDGIYENGDLLNRKTRERLRPDPDSKWKSLEEIEEINLSNLVQRYNLQKHLLEGRALKNIQLEGSSRFADLKDLPYYEEFNREEFDTIYKEGNKYIRFSLDGKKDYGELQAWLEDKDLSLILTTDQEDPDIILDLKKDYPDLISSSIMEIRHINQAFFLENQGFKGLILYIDPAYRDQEVLSYLDLYNFQAVRIEEDQLASRKSLIKEIEKLEIETIRK